MAFVTTTVNGHPVSSDLKEFVCQSVDDISKLPKKGISGTQETGDNEPCAIGSMALVSTGEIFVLFPNNEWCKV